MTIKRSGMDMGNELPPLKPETMASFQEHTQEIIQETVQRSLAHNEDVVHHGEKAQQILTKGLEFTTKMLEAAMSMGEVKWLEDELDWAKDRLPHDGVEMKHVLTRFKIYREVVMETLPPEQADEVVNFINWMIQYQEMLIEQ